MQQKVNLFLDSGSTVSLVSSRFIYYHKLEEDINPSNLEISSFTNDVINIQGEIKLCLKVAGLDLVHNFIVSPLVEDSEFLLGLDIMSKYKFSINIGERKICTPNGTAKFLYKPIQLKKKQKVRCAKTVTLGPNSVNYILCNIPIKSDKNSFVGIMEPHFKLLSSIGIITARAMYYTDLNKIVINCINLTDKPVTIYKGKYMGFLEPVQLNKPIQTGKVQTVRSKENPKPEPDNNEYFTHWQDPAELFDQLGFNNLDLDEQQLQELKTLVKEYSFCFSKNRFDLGKCTFYKATIHLKRDYTPRWIPSRCLPYSQHEYMTKELDNLEKAGIIKPCEYSLWNSQIYIIPKPKQNDYRVICDLRQVNKECIPDSYQLPQVNNILDNMTTCKYFSNFDFTSSFNQVEYDEESQKILAFTWNSKRYMHCRLTQGHLNSSSHFSRMMAQLFNKIPFKQLCYFVDDLLVGSNTFDSHMQRLRFVFERFAYANLKINPRKTKLVQNQVTFLGLTLDSNGVSIDKDKIKIVKELKIPDSVRGVQSVLGFFNYSRNFLPRFAFISRPLYDLLKKGQKFVWDEKCEKAFQTLKKAMITAPCLAIPQIDDPMSSYNIHVDSSSKGMGAVLTQLINGERRIISYWSKSVAPHMKHWPSSKLEFVAMYKALMHWKIYLQGTRKVKIVTDCKALCHFTTVFKNGNAHIQRMLADLAYFNLEVTHISGVSNTMADFLSRYPYKISKRHQVTQTENCLAPGHISSGESGKILTSRPVTDIKNSNHTATNNSTANTHAIKRADKKPNHTPLTIEDIKTAQNTCPILSEVRSWVEAGEKPKNLQHFNQPSSLFSYWRQYKLFFIKSSVLYRKYYNNSGESCDLIVVPASLYERVLSLFHDGLENCHSGVEKSVDSCKQRYWFYHMKQEFELYIGACLICHEVKQPRRYFRAEMTPIVYNEFNQCIVIDHIVPSRDKATPRQNRYILTIVDSFTNYVIAVPTKTQTTVETIQILFEHWFCRFGFPLTILHDQAKGFLSDLMKAISQTFGIRDQHGTSWHSITQGRVEINNKRINTALRASLNESQMKNWDIYLKFVVMSLNSLKNSHTGVSSYFLVHARNIRFPRDLILQDNPNPTLPENSDINAQRRIEAYNIHRAIQGISQRVRQHAQQHVQYTCNSYSKQHSCQIYDFKKGDLCYVKIEVPEYGKLDIRFSGPWTILDKYTDYLFLVQVGEKSKVLNIAKLKPYVITKYTKPEFQRKTYESTAQQTASSSAFSADKSDETEEADLGYVRIPIIPNSSHRHVHSTPRMDINHNVRSESSENHTTGSSSTPDSNPTNDTDFAKSRDTHEVTNLDTEDSHQAANAVPSSEQSVQLEQQPLDDITPGNDLDPQSPEEVADPTQNSEPELPLLERVFEADPPRRNPARQRNQPDRLKYDISHMPRFAYRK